METDATEDRLGVFLRARRARIDPTDVGLIGGGRRRTPGLRREEVATLAGISVEYLTRLEQGRASRPSVEVLDALARALRLDRSAHRHLRLLAGVAPPLVAPRPSVRPSLLATVEALAPAAAYLLSSRFDLLTATPQAMSVLGPLAQAERPNVLRWLFLEPEARVRNRNWDTVVTNATATLRALAPTDRSDPALDELVADLSVSDEFRRRWADHDVQPYTSGLKDLDHPGVGPFTVGFESFTAAAADTDAILVIYQPAGDETSRTAFDLITTITLPA
jgi:transcriptional regulator with XRE-family HTH domain